MAESEPAPDSEFDPEPDPPAPGDPPDAAADLRALYHGAIELALSMLGDPDAAPVESESMPAFALCLDQAGTVSRESGTVGERGADPIYASLFVGAAEGRLRAFAVVTGTVMTHEATGASHEALAVDLEHTGAEPVSIFTVLIRDSTGIASVEKAIPTEGRRVVFVAEA